MTERAPGPSALSPPQLLTLPSLPRRLVAGAPRANWPANESVVNPGAIFRCRIVGNSSGECEQLQLGELAAGRGARRDGAGARRGTEGRCRGTEGQYRRPAPSRLRSAALRSAGPFRHRLQRALPLAPGREQRYCPKAVAASREKTRVKN